MSGLDIQNYLLGRALDYQREFGFSSEETQALAMWQETLVALENDPMSLSNRLDWVAKLNLLNRYQDRHSKDLSSPEAQMIDLQYHDIDPDKGLFNALEKNGAILTFVTPNEILLAKQAPPPTTRAHLRGRFISAAKAKNRDYTVDWVHLKLNDQIQRTVVCNDPFRFEDERVDQLIASL